MQARDHPWQIIKTYARRSLRILGKPFFVVWILNYALDVASRKADRLDIVRPNHHSKSLLMLWHAYGGFMVRFICSVAQQAAAVPRKRVIASLASRWSVHLKLSRIFHGIHERWTFLVRRRSLSRAHTALWSPSGALNPRIPHKTQRIHSFVGGEVVESYKDDLWTSPDTPFSST